MREDIENNKALEFQPDLEQQTEEEKLTKEDQTDIDRWRKWKK